VTLDQANLQARIRLALTGGPPLRLALLFGSGARSELRADSDVDVGIIPRDPHLPLVAELDLQVRLERACGRAVDLVRLDQASTLLRWEAARAGVLVLADPPHEFPRFVATSAIEHADLMTTLAPAAARFRQRLAERDQSPTAHTGRPAP
jgi:predicted nucleotidyltransferase